MFVENVPICSLEVKQISKRYGGNLVLSEISHTFSEGITLIKGPSGGGKSTLLRILATAEKLSHGSILWNGESVHKHLRRYRGRLGYAPQTVQLPEDLTASQLGEYMAALKGLQQVQAKSQFQQICDTLLLSDALHRRIATFSGGMRRRLILAQALLGEPRVLVLDEPTAELDFRTSETVENLLQQYAMSAVVLMTTHTQTSLSDKACSSLSLDKGKLV